jgi:membrane protein YqaA with SNARE-associated domain
MHGFLHSLAHFFFALGGLGLLLLGVLDSSFLMMPLGNDLLVVALTAHRPEHMWYYAAMATIGSTLGVSFAHFVSSRMGQAVIEGKKKSRQIEFVERKIAQYGGLAIGVAALAPPGFPFTPFIVVPAALQYPLKRMASIIFVCRLVRFLLEGWLALIYGRSLLRLADSSALQTFVLVLVAISVVGSIISVWGWIQKGRSRSNDKKGDDDKPGAQGYRPTTSISKLSGSA